MKVVVVIVAYKGNRWIPKCIESIRPSKRHDIHLLIVDNFDTPCLSKIQSNDLPLSIIKTDKPMGFAEANNFAFTHRECAGDAVVLLNQDTWSEYNWIPDCADILEASPGIAAISPTVKQYDNDQLDINYETCLREDAILGSEAAISSITKVPAVALMIRWNDLRAVGPFDPIYGSYYEDYDLCRRLDRRREGIAVAQKPWVRHYSGSATTTQEAREKRMIQIIRNRLIYRLRNDEKNRMWIFLTFLLFNLPKNLLRGLLNTESSQPCFVTLKALISVIRVSPRICSKRRDLSAWKTYLDRIAWGEKIGRKNSRFQPNTRFKDAEKN